MFSEVFNALVRYIIFHLLVCSVQLSDGKIRHAKKRALESHGFESGLCRIGQKQSPIDVKLGELIMQRYNPFQFDSNYRARLRFTLKNTGHTVQASLENTELKPTVTGGGLGGNYVFEQLHFHWGSEHVFDGQRFPLELHVVHYNAKYGNIEEALNHPDGVAVFAVIYDHESDRDVDMDTFFQVVKNKVIYKQSHSPPSPSNELIIDDDDDDEDDSEHLFILRNFLPKNVNAFIRYDGSLTTPACNEVVQWTIFTNHFHVSQDTVETLTNLRDHHGQPILTNFRPPQPINGRPVFAQLNQWTDNRKPNKSTTIQSLSLSSVVICLFIALKLV